MPSAARRRSRRWRARSRWASSAIPPTSATPCSSSPRMRRHTSPGRPSWSTAARLCRRARWCSRPSTRGSEVSNQSLLERRYRVLGRRSPLFYDTPLHLVRGEGVWVYDAEGKRYLDAYNNVPHVGHCHPRVVAALHRQAGTLNTHTRYLDENVVAYAERLVSLFDRQLSMAVFCCTGSEANELALRIARDCSGGLGIIATDWAYHGNTAAVMQVSSLFTPPSARGPYVRTVPVMDPYRDRGGRSDEELATAYADEVKRAIGAFAAEGIRFAGLLFCTAFSSEGLPTVPADWKSTRLNSSH